MSLIEHDSCKLQIFIDSIFRADNKYLSQITLHNDHLISKLEKLRKEKVGNIECK